MVLPMMAMEDNESCPQITFNLYSADTCSTASLHGKGELANANVNATSCRMQRAVNVTCEPEWKVFMVLNG